MSGFANDTNPSKLGGTPPNNRDPKGFGAPGFQPKLLGGGGGSTGGSGMTGSSERGRDREVLRNVLGSQNRTESSFIGPFTNVPHGRGAQTPFRLAMNAGDVNSLVNLPPHNSPLLRHHPSNQVNNVRRASLASFGFLGGGVRMINNANVSGSLYSGNPKFVYDGSDYTRFKKLQAKNRNYNDRSFGGPEKGKSSSMLVALGRVRH
jgi:hypothetical protein